MHVVRDDQDVEIETTFTNNDIGFVEIGQKADINLDACPSERFEFVTGVVSDVAADSTEATEGVWAFEVRITPDDKKLTNGTEQLTLRPGMTAAVDITTDKQRLISYFFAPIVDVVQDAREER